MSQKYIIFFSIIVLSFLAGNFSFPDYFNKTADFLNGKFKLNAPHFWTKPFVFGLDLEGGVSLVYQADLSSVAENEKSEAMGGLRDVIERRVNLFGVTEPVVQIQGENRLIIELPGVTNVKEAIRMIGETPYLQFLEARPEEETQKILDKIKELEGKSQEEILKIENWQLALENPYFKPTELTGKYLSRATVLFDQTTFRPEIQLQFNSEGAKLFEEITERNTKKPLAIFLDGFSIIDTNGDRKIDRQDLYAPIVQGKIPGGKAVITGDMSVQGANEIARRLNSGALPVKIGQPISQKTVGPTLGSDSLNKSLLAGIYGFLAVVLFMLLVYRIPGFLASLALLIYVAITLSLFKFIPVTLSLAGIGGFILSLGMAVDANILIFARMKEEIKQGKNFSLAIEEGFRRAWPSIRDSNFNSLIVCAVLFIFSTSFVKGFALTLAVGILVSMFSAIFITRIFLLIFVGRLTEKLKWLI